MEYKELKNRLEKIGLKLHCDIFVSFDDGKTYYDTWLEYWNKKRNYWGVEHVFGKFKTKEEAIEVVCRWLEMNHIKY